MSVRSRALYAGAPVATGGGRLLWTCPAGRTAILKTLSVSHTGAAARSVEVVVARPSTSAYMPLHQMPAMPPATAYVLAELDVVLEPGDTLQSWASGDTTALVRVGAWGVLLSGTPT